MDSKTETLFVVSPQSLERWEIIKTPLDASQHIAARFSDGVIRRVRNVFRENGDPFGQVDMATDDESKVWWTVDVEHLYMNTPFAVKSGILVPNFAGENSPNVQIKWKVPDDMTLLLTLVTERITSAVYSCGEQYLHAFDDNSEAWKLPTSNVYDDCRLCSGDFNSDSSDHFGALQKALHQFKNSKWNRDLMPDGEEERLKTELMFRFKPKNDGFEQLPMQLPLDRTWSCLCKKVSSQITTRYAVL